MERKAESILFLLDFATGYIVGFAIAVLAAAAYLWLKLSGGEKK
jgi:hypothetical protein